MSNDPQSPNTPADAQLPLVKLDAPVDLVLPDPSQPRLTHSALAGTPAETAEAQIWNDAFTRLEDYLASYQIEDRLHMTRLALKIFEQARAKATTPEGAKVDPTTLVVKEAQEHLDAWFAELMRDKEVPASRVNTAGRLIMVLTHAHSIFPSPFVAEHLPTEMQAALQKDFTKAGPDVEFTRMTPRELDFGFLPDIANETWQKFRWRGIVRDALIWVCIFFIVVLVYNHLYPPDVP